MRTKRIAPPLVAPRPSPPQSVPSHRPFRTDFSQRLMADSATQHGSSMVPMEPVVTGGEAVSEALWPSGAGATALIGAIGFRYGTELLAVPLDRTAALSEGLEVQLSPPVFFLIPPAPDEQVFSPVLNILRARYDSARVDRILPTIC